MTPQEEKELAEFGAEFLKLEKTNLLRKELQRKGDWMLLVTPYPGVYLKPESFFGSATAPILADLAKREMEKRGFEWYGQSAICKKYRYYIMNQRGKLSDETHENEYQALWLAIREATK